MSIVPMTEETARTLIEMFERTYTERDGVWVNKVGREAPELTLQIVDRARASAGGL
jgi:hypothetical protein